MKKPVELLEFRETLDNWGKEDFSDDPYKIETIIKDHENWSDDMRFLGSDGNIYYIENLIDNEFLVNGKIMKITE